MNDIRANDRKVQGSQLASKQVQTDIKIDFFFVFSLFFFSKKGVFNLNNVNIEHN